MEVVGIVVLVFQLCLTAVAVCFAHFLTAHCQSATIRSRFRFQAVIVDLSLRFYQLKLHSDFIKNVHLPRRRNLGYLSWYSLTSRFWVGIYLLFWKSKPLLL